MRKASDERRQELTNQIEQLSKVILCRKSDVGGGRTNYGRGAILEVRQRFDSRNSGAGNQGQPENWQLDWGEMQAQQPSLSSWGPTRYK